MQIATILSGAALVLLAEPAASQCYEGTLQPITGHGDDLFGSAVDLSGDRLLVGSPGHVGPQGERGAVFAYLRDPATDLWLERQGLLPVGGVGTAKFGESLASSGEWLFVGAPQDGEAAGNAGAAYVFREVGGAWVQTQKLLATQAEPDQRFGGHVAVSGEVAVVGAAMEDAGGFFRGAAYVYRLDATSGQWNLELRLPAPKTLGSFAQFGTQVAVDGEFLAVAAPYTGGAGVNLGEVHLWRWDRANARWRAHSVQQPAGLPNGSAFGSALSMEGPWLVVGAHTPGPLPEDPDGAAYAYRYDTVRDRWELRQELKHPFEGYDQRIGDRLDVTGDRMIVASTGGSLAIVYEFDEPSDTWVLGPVHAHASNGPAPSWSAPAVAIEGSTAVLGDRGDAWKGEVLIYDDRRCSPLGLRTCSPALPNSLGLSGRLDVFGSDVISDDLLSVRAMNLPTQEIGLVLASMTQDSVDHAGGSDGRLCLGGDIARFNEYILRSTYTGNLARTLDVALFPANPPQPVMAGQTWSFQLWHRDGASSNFTDAVAVLFR